MGAEASFLGRYFRPRKNSLSFIVSRNAVIFRCVSVLKIHTATLQTIVQVTFNFLHLQNRSGSSESYYHKVATLERTFLAYLSVRFSDYSFSSVTLYGASDLF